MSVRYALKALWYLIRPWTWVHGREREEFRRTLAQWFDARCDLFFSGRQALLTLLKAWDAKQGSEVIIQGYTCVALPNAIHAAGYTPVFVDCDPDTLNIDLQALTGKISPRTKAIICQHTLGIPADTEALHNVAKKHDLLLIEDCAHVLPDVTGPKSIGTYADALMLSFGRDKAISGITGGALITKNPALRDAIDAQTEAQCNPPRTKVALLLLYAPLYLIARPLYGILVGKLLLFVAKKLGLLLPVLSENEKNGFQDSASYSMPNACAGLALMQLRKLHTLNNHRRVLTKLYLGAAKQHNWKIPKDIHADLPLQKFALYTENGDTVRKRLKKRHIYLEDGWTGAAVCPRSVDQEHAGYSAGSCPHAEKVDREILTLPTHPTMTKLQAEKLVKVLKALLG